MTESTDEWYSAAEAQEVLGISRRQLDRLVKGNVITAVMKAGKKRYRVEDVDDIEPSEEAPKPDGDLLAGLKQTQGHLETMVRHYDTLMKNVNAPLVTLTEAWKTEMAGMRGRVEQLEEVHMQVIKERENLATDSSVRDMANREYEATQRRKDEAWAMFQEKVLPKLMGNGELQKFLAGFDDEQVQALSESDFLAPEQLEVINRLRGNASNGAGKVAPDASKKGQN